jgi:N-acetylglucosamine kinase-like BadF-type ATPase
VGEWVSACTQPLDRWRLQLVGVPVACSRILELVDRAFVDALASEKVSPATRELLEAASKGGPPGSSPPSADGHAALHSIGLAMSGCAEVRNQVAVRNELVRLRPSLVATPSHIVVGNDTAGAAFTAAPDGGLVVICGTGTMAEGFLRDGRSFRSGGWGHMLGDEASGFWISHRALSAAFRAADGFDMDPGVTPPDPTPVLDVALRVLGRARKEEILEDMYAKFDKSRVASLTRELAALARSTGDTLASEAFCAAGTALGGMVRTVAPRMLLNPDASDRDKRDAAMKDLVVVAVGSVWNAWDLLKDSFVAAARAKSLNLVTPGGGHTGDPVLRGSVMPGSSRGVALTGAIRIVRLAVPASVGSAVLGARVACKVALPVDYSSSTTTLDVV